MTNVRRLAEHAAAVIAFALCVAAGASWNSLSVLACAHRAVKNGHEVGLCTLRRGSALSTYTETILVNEIKRVSVEGAHSDVRHRAVDGPGERVYLISDDDAYALLDSGLSHEEREQLAARIRAFLANPLAAPLHVELDARPRFLGFGALAGLGVAGAMFGLRRRRSRRA